MRVGQGSSRFPSPERLVVFGDVHGDLAATVSALRMAGAMDDDHRWVGKDMVLVQTGDQLDRGDDEPEILDLFAELQRQAVIAGGAFHVLNGNHEIMNVSGDLRYVTPDGFQDYEDPAGGSDPARLPKHMRGRMKAFSPGGKEAQRLATRPIVIVVGETVFVHGGVTPQWARYGIEQTNLDAQDFLLGRRPTLPPVLAANDGPVWSRDFSDAPDAEDCALLEQSLAILGVKRMVVGHTVDTKGIRSACEERVWMVDVGMAAHYGGAVAVLEIRGDALRVLTGDVGEDLDVSPSH